MFLSILGSLIQSASKLKLFTNILLNNSAGLQLNLPTSMLPNSIADALVGICTMITTFYLINRNYHQWAEPDRITKHLTKYISIALGIASTAVIVYATCFDTFSIAGVLSAVPCILFAVFAHMDLACTASYHTLIMWLTKHSITGFAPHICATSLYILLVTAWRTSLTAGALLASISIVVATIASMYNSAGFPCVDVSFLVILISDVAAISKLLQHLQTNKKHGRIAQLICFQYIAYYILTNCMQQSLMKYVVLITTSQIFAPATSVHYGATTIPDAADGVENINIDWIIKQTSKYIVQLLGVFVGLATNTTIVLNTVMTFVWYINKLRNAIQDSSSYNDSMLKAISTLTVIVFWLAYILNPERISINSLWQLICLRCLTNSMNLTDTCFSIAVCAMLNVTRQDTLLIAVVAAAFKHMHTKALLRHITYSNVLMTAGQLALTMKFSKIKWMVMNAVMFTYNTGYFLYAIQIGGVLLAYRHMLLTTINVTGQMPRSTLVVHALQSVRDWYSSGIVALDQLLFAININRVRRRVPLLSNMGNNSSSQAQTAFNTANSMVIYGGAIAIICAALNAKYNIHQPIAAIVLMICNCASITYLYYVGTDNPTVSWTASAITAIHIGSTNMLTSLAVCACGVLYQILFFPNIQTLLVMGGAIAACLGLLCT
jgi:hypothetical protein